MAKALAAPVLRVIVFEVAAVSTGEEVKVRVKAPAVPVNFNPLNVATPLTAVAVSVVASTPPVPEAIATVTTVVVSVVTILPEASRICTTGCWVKALPLTALAEG